MRARTSTLSEEDLKMNKLALLAAAALTATSFGVAGAIAQAGGTDDFAKADANKDGYVDMTEAQGIYANLTQDLFTKADANADGKLDATEFAALQGLAGALPQSTDTNSSDMSKDEASSSAQ
jgi:hypothetical protein